MARTRSRMIALDVVVALGDEGAVHPSSTASTGIACRSWPRISSRMNS